MDFTREPIIETIVTPKEGYKLIIRNSKGGSQEEYLVDALEIVSFGKSLFFRSLEKPKAFLLPISDYEVLEAKEVRSVLKKPQVEKSIKIGKGKTESAKRKVTEEIVKEEQKKQEKKRTSKRKTKEKPIREKLEPSGEKKEEIAEEGKKEKRTLLPPPAVLISEQINRYKDYLSSEEESKVEKMPIEESNEPSLPFHEEFLPSEEEIVSSEEFPSIEEEPSIEEDLTATEQELFKKDSFLEEEKMTDLTQEISEE